MTTNDFSSYDYDNFSPGYKLKIDHTVYSNDNSDLTDLISKSLDEVIALRESNLTVEQAAYEKVRETAKEWEKAAAVTGRLDKAIEYLKIPQVTHTSNEWVQDSYKNKTISNMVYKMTYSIYERSSWKTDSKKYDVRWNIYTNTPNSSYTLKIAGQDKVYSNKEDAEKYMHGRIKAYAHLFTEISPPIPKEYEKSFRVYGQLLPGYTTEEMQQEQKTEKPSIRKQLASLKAQEKSNPTPQKTQKRSEQEI